MSGGRESQSAKLGTIPSFLAGFAADLREGRLCQKEAGSLGQRQRRWRISAWPDVPDDARPSNIEQAEVCINRQEFITIVGVQPLALDWYQMPINEVGLR